MENQVDEVRYSRSAAKFIKSRTPKEKQHLKDVIETNLKTLPPKGDIKPLQGFGDGRKRLRVGGIRIIFTYDTEGKLLVLSIIDIGNRGDVYK
jgi:mRNA interferase RelE/StbE